MIRKVTAFITRDTARGRELLVFTHRGVPEAGVQVPAGTVEADEYEYSAVLREAWEETGLRDLTVVTHLGLIEDTTDRGQRRQRHFYHLHLERPAPETWEHPADGEIFKFHWRPINEPILLEPTFAAWWERFRDHL